MIPAFRVTAGDLPDFDKKARSSLEPLLRALNRCLTLVITTVNSLETPILKTASFTTAVNGASYVTFGLNGPATDLWVTRITPADGSTLDSVYSMSWIPTTTGAQLLFVGLAPLTTYNLRIQYL